jgi:molecular chaperone DnaJ
VSFAQATLGAEIGIPTLEGEQTLRIPEGTQSGTVLRLKNKGLPAVNGFGKGDLYIEVQVQTPSKLTKRQRELLLEFDAGQQIENKPERRSLLAKMKEMFG